jgi:hypothetical protein
MTHEASENELARIKQAMADGEHTDGDLAWCVDELAAKDVELVDLRKLVDDGMACDTGRIVSTVANFDVWVLRARRLRDPARALRGEKVP